jgi:hypothetical protein
VGKILGSFSGMRKYLEKEMLADSLKGRIRYGCTTYTGMDGAHVFEICIDGESVKRFSWETVNRYFTDCGYKTKDGSLWKDFFALLKQYPLSARSEYLEEEFCEALATYRNQNIQDSLFSENPLVRMFAVLDRRIGKRTLEKIKGDIDKQPTWLRRFYRLRLEAEVGFS